MEVLIARRPEQFLRKITENGCSSAEEKEHERCLQLETGSVQVKPPSPALLLKSNSTFDQQRWICHPWHSAWRTPWVWPGLPHWAGETSGSGRVPLPPGSWSESCPACPPRRPPLLPADWWASCACSPCSGLCSTSGTLQAHGDTGNKHL